MAMVIKVQAILVSGCVSPRLNMTVFDRKIIQILLYGCLIWGSYNKVDQSDKQLFKIIPTNL